MEKVIINGRTYEAEKGTLLSRVLQENIGYRMPCGQKGICGKCKVHAAGILSAPDAVENEKLTSKEREAGIRLACRTTILGDCRVTAEETGKSNILLETDKDSISDRKLFEKLGAAVDIGTTTLAARLYDGNGLLAQAGALNPQGTFGADVISRIEKSLDGEGRALADLIRGGISEILERLAQMAGRSAEEIDTLVLTGNTAMLYLLMDKDVTCLSKAPFAADWLAGEWITARELGLSCKEARVYLPRCMSAFVGADITTALLASGIHHTQGLRLLVDIGTNGEIALWKNGGLLCCSTAAGPAFEGAGLHMGMQGETGAIDHVTWTGEEMRVQVIGGVSPKGICGSGVVDAVSCLLTGELMDETGFLEDGDACIAGEVYLTQEDIRKVQLAKSAICAGIMTMLYRAGKGPADLDELLVAGGFGSYLNLKNAIAIGLLPEMELERIRVCGNAALAGAVKILLDADCIAESEELAKQAETINLAADDYFKDNYMEGMLF